MIEQRMIFQIVKLSALLLFVSVIFNGCFNQDQQQINELLDKGIEYAQDGKFEKGIANFSKILEIDPDNYMGYYHRGLAHKSLKNYSKSIFDLNRCAEINPNDSSAYFQLGGILCDQGKLEEGIHFYSKAIEINPDHIEAYGAMGIIKSILGKVDSGLEDLNSAIRVNPKSPILYVVRAQILELKGDCQGAIENYEKAMSIDSEQFNTKSDIAWILAACPDSKYRDSEKAHKQATEFSESQRKYKTLRTLAAAYAGKGDYANALIYQEKAVQALQEKEYNNELEKIYYEDQLKQSMEQLNSYRKEIPWYF